jgi:hypothetical protein
LVRVTFSTGYKYLPTAQHTVKLEIKVMKVNDEQKWLWKEATMAYLLATILEFWTDKNHVNLRQYS